MLGERTYRRLSSEEQIILGTAFLEQSVSNQRLQQMLDLHPTDIGKILSRLVEKGMLLSAWKGRWTTYTINKDYKKRPEQLDFSDFNEPEIEFTNETDKQIYGYIKINGMITAKQVIDITRINTQQGASNALNRLIARGLIIKAGVGHHTHYVLAKEK